jgi:N-acetylglucosaminyldiphosphoundecaprenol N-acetyl-beta-D-mannosaminyltransferase
VQLKTMSSTLSKKKNFSTLNVKGIDVAAIDVYRASDLIGELATATQESYVTITGAHGIVESQYNKDIFDAHRNASLVVPDGMPLVWLGRLLGFNSIGRVYGPDLMECIFSNEAYRELRHFFYGSSPSVVSQLRDALVARFGEFNMVGMYCPPMRPLGFNEDEAVLSRIRDLKPHIIWVGLSTPKQEVWMHMHMPKIGTGVGIGVGAAFDLLSGQTLQAPRYIQRSGFEWLFRLAMEPRRLFKRYFFVIPRFSVFFLQTFARQRRKT